MLFARSTAETNAVRAIERGSQALTSSMLADLLALASTSWKPAGYDAHQNAIRLRYEGRALAIHRAAKRARYPATHDRLPDLPFNWVKLIGQVDASVYDYEPERYLVEDGARIDDDDPRAKLFADRVRDAELSVRMAEMERRAMVAQTMFAQVTWRRSFAERDRGNPRAGRPHVELYWPGDVFVIPHHTRPNDLDAAVALLARKSGPTGLAAREGVVEVGGGAAFPRGDWWQVWTRPVNERDDGSIESFGPWSVEEANLAGDRMTPFGDAGALYPGRILPWAVYRVGLPQGCPYVDEDRDFALIADAVNVNWSNLVYVTDMQGHDQMIVSGHTAEKGSVVLGPDVVHHIGPNETASMISPNPKLDAMLETNKTLKRELAVTRRQSPDAYATERGPPLTGISRRIANEPQDKARQERGHMAKVFEETQLLPILNDVCDEWGEQVLGDVVVARMDPKRPPAFDDPIVVQQRSIEAVDKGWIDDARGAVEAGWYPNEDAAREGMGKLEPAPTAAPAGGAPMTKMQAALVGAGG